MGLKDTDSISRTAQIAQRLFEDRMLVITAKDSMLHRFNEVGTFIWQQLEKPQTVGDVCAAIAQHFEGTAPGDVSRDLRQFLETLEKKGCIQIGRKET